MGSLRHGIALGLISASMIGGCVVSSDDSGPTGPQYKYPSESDFCRAVGQADCSDAVLNACYGSANQQNRDSCISAASSAGNCNPTNVGYHPQTAEACVEAHRSVYSDGIISQDDVKSLATACISVLNNGLGQDAPCGADSDCDAGSGLRCVIPLGQDRGNCTKPTIVGGGQKCSSADQVCADGFFCNTDGYCVVGGDLGTACSDTQPCQSDFNCVGTAAVGTCQAKAGDGSSCSVDADCKSTFCVKGSGSTSGVCRTSYNLVNSERCSEFLP